MSRLRGFVLLVVFVLACTLSACSKKPEAVIPKETVDLPKEPSAAGAAPKARPSPLPGGKAKSID